jgi:site-specific DNA-methyltransferase (adenine-specific)
MADEGSAPNRIIHGDSREVLRTLPAASVDAVVTDPPAGISFMSKEWDDPSAMRDGDGRADREAFVGFLREIMAECFRVLKPGGHALVWAIPRTSHWTAWALEEAGFEIRDCVYHVFGQGFPKSLNVSKAIDRIKGAKREVVGSYRVGGNALTPTSEKGGTYGVGVPNSPAGDLPITKPATPEAIQWDGWGTALKPAVECWWLCRKPVEEKSVAAQVLKTGTGAINIDGTRISGIPQVPGSVRSYRRFDDKGDKPELAPPPPPNPEGRWPSNLMLSHSPGCRRVGTVQAPAPVINRFDDGMKPFGEGAGHPYTQSGGGTEDVPVYECEPGCPVKTLDEQSGERPVSGTASLGKAQEAPSDGYGGGWGGAPRELPNDSGGASRYFQTFAPKGRWPSNIVLSHSPACVRRGTKQVKTGVAHRTNSGGSNFGSEIPKPPLEDMTYGDENGMETVEDWECAKGCPIAEMDRQGEEMGIHKAGSPLAAQVKWDLAESTPSYGGGFSGPSGMRYGDEGGASRFFQNLEPEVPFFYTAKAAKSEKEDGLEGTPDGKRVNVHPTVKPVSLMRYLVKMVTPPGGVVLDPFAGSGSTLIAAVQEGMRYIGIERETEYVKIAEKRLGVITERVEVVRTEQEIFELMMALDE